VDLDDAVRNVRSPTAPFAGRQLRATALVLAANAPGGKRLVVNYLLPAFLAARATLSSSHNHLFPPRPFLVRWTSVVNSNRLPSAASPSPFSNHSSGMVARSVPSYRIAVAWLWFALIPALFAREGLAYTAHQQLLAARRNLLRSTPRTCSAVYSSLASNLPDGSSSMPLRPLAARRAAAAVLVVCSTGSSLLDPSQAAKRQAYGEPGGRRHVKAGTAVFSNDSLRKKKEKTLRNHPLQPPNMPPAW